jgi:glycosyltransferase involved in cell wall biosynthesis
VILNFEGIDISAVMFVYNEEKYISQMLDSILNQNLSVSEIIIIDDFSNDNTKSIINKYSSKHPQISYYLNDHKGKIFAYQKGLSLVKTNYFFVCAGDDVLLPHFTVKMYELLKSENVHFAYARYFMVDENLANPIQVKRADTYKFNDILKSNRVSGYLFGKKDVIDVILPINTKFSFEDWISVLKLTFKYGQVNLSKEPLFYYRKHEKSTTQQLKNVGVRKRDLSFIELIFTENIIPLSNDVIRILEHRKLYLEQLTGFFSFVNSAKLLFSKNLFFIDKIRLLLLFLPFVKNDNDVQEILNRILKFKF